VAGRLFFAGSVRRLPDGKLAGKPNIFPLEVVQASEEDNRNQHEGHDEEVKEEISSATDPHLLRNASQGVGEDDSEHAGDEGEYYEPAPDHAMDRTTAAAYGVIPDHR
jgi:hypothetical protein